MKKKHNESDVIRSLSRKRDISIKGKTLLILSKDVWSKRINDYAPNPRKRNDLGNKSWGKIDFLMKYCGYKIKTVSDFRR